MCTELQLNQITNEISKKTKNILGNRLYKIILYGSYARGDYDNESDIDIMVLADIPNSEKSVLQNAIDIISSDISLKNDITVTISLKNIHFFDEHKDVLPFYKNVIGEGIEVYGA